MYSFTDEGLEWLKEQGVEFVKVEAPAGSLIICASLRELEWQYSMLKISHLQGIAGHRTTTALLQATRTGCAFTLATLLLPPPPKRSSSRRRRSSRVGPAELYDLPHVLIISRLQRDKERRTGRNPCSFSAYPVYETASLIL